MKLSKKLPIAVLAASALAAGAGAPAAQASCHTVPLDKVIEDIQVGCLENVICGAPHAVAERTGIDKYVDPQMNCVE